MISEFFLNIIFNIVNGLLSVLPEITVPAMMARDSIFSGMLRCALYFLPLGTVGTIVGLLVSITSFKITIAIIKTIWDLLPIV